MVIAVDINPDKLGLARQFGADETIDPREPNAIQKVMDLTGGGVDVALEFAGAIPALEAGTRC